MAEVTMTLEELLELTGMEMKRRGGGPKVAKRVAKRVGKKDPKMGRALEKANEMGRKKSGGFKKGWSQSKIMSKAHQLRRKMG